MSFRTSIPVCVGRQKVSSTSRVNSCKMSLAFPVVGAVLLVTSLVGVSSSWQSAAGSSSAAAASVGATSQACVYEGHLKTDKNWYGYLANITIMTTGRLNFEFIYPADKCCQNVLFYSEDQMAVINARMNCWQKEYPLRPEDDQILRLTPRFSWSGCHKTYPNNVAIYVCKGGRSFTVDHHRHQYEQQRQRYDQHEHQHPQQQQQQQQGWRQNHRGTDNVGHGYATWGGSDSRTVRNRPTTWYIALSNCGSLYGLELRYRMEVYGHVGECQTNKAHFDYYRPGVPSFGSLPSPRPVVAASEADDGDKSQVSVDEDAAADDEAATRCVVEGDINTTETWYVIGNATRTTTAADVGRSSGFKYDFSFPQSMTFLHMGIYGEAEQMRLQEDYDSCWHKHSVIPSQKFYDRLSTRSGCQLKNTTKLGLSYVCSGRRGFTPGPAGPAAGSERQILVAIDNCRVEQLVASYRVEMYGFVCNSAASGSLALPTVDWNSPIPIHIPTSIISVVRAPVYIVFVYSRPICLGAFVAFALSTSRLLL